MEDLRYPIGPFAPPDVITDAIVEQWIDDIARLPADLRRAVEALSDAQLDTPYRPDGWTVRQVVHHVADSHLNSVVRFKWALTEDRPTIKAYDEGRWAELGDYALSIDVSLDFLDQLHRRWVGLLRGLNTADLERSFVHPDSGPIALRTNIGAYVWHGRHHLAHIERLIQREGWS